MIRDAEESRSGQFQPITCEIATSGQHVLNPSIVSRGEWLGKPANFKGAGYCLAFEVETGCHVTYTVHHSSQHSKQDGGR